MFRPSFLPFLWMLLGAFAFACMAVLTAELKEELAWQWIAVARSGLAMLFAATLVIGAGAQFVFLRPWTLWMRSLAGSVSLLCGFFAMTHYDVAVVLTLTNMYPLWIAVLSWPLLGIAPSRGTWLAAGIGVLGVAVLSWSVAHGGNVESAATAEELNTEGLLAIAASLLAAFTSGIALIGLHRLKELDARAVVVHFSGVGLAGCLLAASVLPHDPPAAAWSNAALLMLLGVGLSATAGQIFLTKAFAAGEPARISVVGLSQIGFAVLLQRMLHPRSYSLLTLAGMTMIVAPTIWVLLEGKAKLGLNRYRVLATRRP